MSDARRDPPWLFRTYAGHSTAATSNALFRRNLAKGQTGLSMAVLDAVKSSGETAPEPFGQAAEGLDNIPVIVGGKIPDADAATLKGLGVAAV